VRIKLTLMRPGGSSVDLVVTADTAATVGQLAGAIADRDPAAKTPVAPGPLSLDLVNGHGRTSIDPLVTLGDSQLRSGSTVIVTAAEQAATAAPRAAAAVVRVTVGPDAGKAFSLAVGTSLVGRNSDCEIRLSDPLVSRHHAKLHVTDTVEVVDLGSANGVMVGGGLISRAVLRHGDEVVIGDTTFGAEMVLGTAAESDSAVEMFNRSPRLDPDFVGTDLSLPEPPDRFSNQRIPILPLIAPVFVGALLYLITRTLTSLAFVALSPVMLLANIVESRLGGRRAYRNALEEFHSDLEALDEQIAVLVHQEQTQRSAEHPDTSQCLLAARDRTPLLWTRRPGTTRFLSLRLGLANLPSRIRLEMPRRGKATKDVWAELEEFTAQRATVEGVPAVAAFTETGSLGVAGPAEPAQSVARALLAQAVTLHSPAELVLCALVPSDRSATWDWLKWLPHSSSAHSPIGTDQLACDPASAGQLVSALEDLVAQRRDAKDDAGPVVLVFVDDAPPVDRSRLVKLASDGPAGGVYLLWLAPSRALLPGTCGVFLDVDGGGPDAVAGYLDTGTAVTPVTCESISAAQVAELARSLAPLIDSGAPLDDDSDLPASISWLELHGRELASSSAAVIERWVESSSLVTGRYAPPAGRGRPGSLRAVLGQNAGEPHIVDLRANGPHALVGGTTGSGKSELLQSWILGMAAAHSPQRVNFLLVDYKGGSAFSECVRLPHTIGLVTDLTPHLVRRALISLLAELRYREKLFGQKRAKDLIELETRGDPEAPPSLVIVVDEFAALVQEVPEFVDGVVNVAQRGRSLGLHLILATQRPAGVIKDNLRANTNLRLALRVADEDDSMDVLGSPIAAGFDPALPGRSVSKTGPGRLVPFQAAYVGGWTAEDVQPPRISLQELTLGRGAVWDEPDSGVTDGVDLGPTDIRRVVDVVVQAHALAELPAPRKPWRPELAHAYDLAKLPSPRRDDELVFGVRDDPENQDQPAAVFHPDRHGNLVVYGTGGSGKSTLLRTVAIAAGFAIRGGPCHVYALDFGARGLDMLEVLPHVGSVITGSDHERITRLLGDLRAMVDERAARYATVNAGTINAYRERGDAPDEPRILLLVDGLAAFRSAYEVGDRSRWFDLFVSLATDGRPVGLNVLLTADRPGAVPSALGSSLPYRVVCRLADDNDYGMLGAPGDILDHASPPGRALVGDDEIQVAVLGGNPDVLQQASAISELALAMTQAGVGAAPAVGRLTDRISIPELPVQLDGEPVIGVLGATLTVGGFNPRGSFLIAGPPGSGRTTALMATLESLRRWRSGLAYHYVGSQRSALAGLPLWTTSATSPQQAAELATTLVPQIRAGAGELAHIVVIESVADFLNGMADFPLQELAKAVIDAGQLLLCEGETSSVSGSYQLLQYAKSGRAGLALQPEQIDGTSVFRTAFPRLSRAEFPPGRGLLVGRRSPQVIQVAMPTDALLVMGTSTHSET